MNRSDHLQQGRGAVEIIEEAVYLLRLSPASFIASYYIGSLPFILGLLFFWADMSRSASAYRYCAVESFGLAILFVWMKCWHAVFAGQLRACLSGEPGPRWTLPRVARLASAQTVIQPSGFFVLPVAFLMALPFGWVYAFYQNVSAEGNGECLDVRTVVKRACQQAKFWPKQNHILLIILFIFGVFIFVNIGISVFLLPNLLKSLLGIETVFTKSGWNMLNTTFFAAVCGLAYLCMDPLVKSVYVLRCFYASSCNTGEDLRVELKQFLSLKKVLAGTMIFLVATGTPHMARAHEKAKTPSFEYRISGVRVSPIELDRSIREVMSRREYTWRMPREQTAKENRDRTGLLATVMNWIGKTLRSGGRTIRGWIEKIGAWLEKLLPSTQGRKEPSGKGWMTSVRNLLLGLLALLVGVLAIVIWRTWRKRRTGECSRVSEAIHPTPDLTDDQVGADELPVDRWLVMARELMGKGELRLALRALYLATLAYLADHDLITIARHKSNREYRLELERRAHDQLDLLAVFSKNVAMFDRAWYGTYPVNSEEMRQFKTNHERIRAYIEG